MWQFLTRISDNVKHGFQFQFLKFKVVKKKTKIASADPTENMISGKRRLIEI